MKLLASRTLRMLALASLLAGCATSPTGQHQLLLFPDTQMVRMGADAFAQMKADTPESQDPAVRAYVECVARHITAEVESDASWEVRVFDDPQANAFALPGGKIGVYTGLLDVAENQHQLAAVIGHEVRHVTANHGNARVSAAYASQAGLTLAQIVAGASSQEHQQLLALLGLGIQVGVLLPYGRGQETEADILGLDVMAQAGFDPREAVALWRNMSAASEGKQPPAFLSTHPSHDARIARLGERMPHALALREAALRQGKRPSCR